MNRLRRSPSHAGPGAASIVLLAALGRTSYAAVEAIVPDNSVGTAQPHFTVTGTADLQCGTPS